MGEAEARPFLDEGERHLQSGDFAAAEHAFARAVELAPDSAVAHSKLGVALAHQSRLDEAVSRFNHAIAVAPSYAPAYSNLGNAYRAKGMLPEALAAYQRAVTIDPDYWIAHQNLGILYKQMGRVGEAVEHLKRATRLSVRHAGPVARATRRGCLPAAVLLILVAAAILIL